MPQIDRGPYLAVAVDPMPLKYKMKSVLCHDGGSNAGHWTATVTDAQQVNHIDDHRVRAKSQGYLRSNPQDRMQAINLTYVRIHLRSV